MIGFVFFVRNILKTLNLITDWSSVFQYYYFSSIQSSYKETRLWIVITETANGQALVGAVIFSDTLMTVCVLYSYMIFN